MRVGGVAVVRIEVVRNENWHSFCSGHAGLFAAVAGRDCGMKLMPRTASGQLIRMLRCILQIDQYDIDSTHPQLDLFIAHLLVFN